MTSGLLVTCYKNRQQSSFKAITHELSSISNHRDGNDDTDIFAIEIKKEVRAELGKHNVKYVSFRNISNIYFIDNRTSLDAKTIAHRLMNRNINHTHKILALDLFVEYNAAALNAISGYLDEKIEGLDVSMRTFKIAFKQRCSNLCVKEILFDMILCRMKRFGVDLTRPDITIHVQVIKNSIGVCLGTLSS